jgi:hypothetical protein
MTALFLPRARQTVTVSSGERTTRCGRTNVIERYVVRRGS